MSEPYHLGLIEQVMEIARQQNIHLHRGVFVAVSGPNLETRAEYRFLRQIGADVVGMSTVPEVIVAVHCGLPVVGFSIITDLCFPDTLEPTNVEQIIANWTLPMFYDKARHLEATALVTVGRDGQVIRSEILKTSGDLVFDESALRAIKR